MDRRRFHALICGALLAAPFAGFAQQAGKVRRIGYLHLAPAASETGQWGQRVLRDALRRAGYEEGKNIVIEWRWAEGKLEQLQALADDLFAAKSN